MFRSISRIGRGSDGVLRQSADRARHANWGVLFLLALATVALTPAVALAWTPGTHVFLADAKHASFLVKSTDMFCLHKNRRISIRSTSWQLGDKRYDRFI